jgi:hypothetical protein
MKTSRKVFTQGNEEFQTIKRIRFFGEGSDWIEIDWGALQKTNDYSVKNAKISFIKISEDAQIPKSIKNGFFSAYFKKNIKSFYGLE